ncbi:MAG: class II aldolase/adducin family protein [Deltaproteobacteria bacterium]|nr:class II aldolase/adducin family protein [Deltaproteobacteria bacterium]
MALKRPAMLVESRARTELVRHGVALWTKGWVANHDGNLSARVSDDRLVCTPTATSKRDLDERHLVVTDTSGAQISGSKKPFGELNIHLAVYRARPDIAAVVHAHSPYATALGASGRELACFLPEAVVSLGARVPLAPLAAPGPGAVTAIEPLIAKFDAVLVQANGVWAWGVDVEQAFLRLELVEHLACIAHHAQSWGGPQPLPQDMLERLLEARRKAFGR